MMNEDTLLLRQIHPNFLQEGRPTSQAFRPTPKDQDKLSVYDGDQISPEGAFRHYTEKLELKSEGVLAVSVRECASRELQVHPDPTAFAEHVLIDFTGLNKNETERKAKQLRLHATERGWLYPQVLQR